MIVQFKKIVKETIRYVYDATSATGMNVSVASTLENCIELPYQLNISVY